MILENTAELKYRSKVTRVCDECGNKSVARWAVLQDARKKRGNEKDYCKKCSYKYRISHQETMEKSPAWNGGRYLNENGYYRIYRGNLKYEYEHKIVLSNHLGRKLLPTEKVHFIDLNKTNIDLSNLYLCMNKASHWRCHQSMEECAFSLLNKHVWFDATTKIYVLNQTLAYTNDINIEDLLELKFYKERRRETSGYYKLINGKNKRFLHDLIAERIIGRPLLSTETTHHINGNTLDNDSSNIIVMLRSEHKICHYSLQNCISSLYKNGIIGFSNGEYFYRGEK